VPTLICLDEMGTAAAGPLTFLDEILMIAGGKNVLDEKSPHWPSIDREKLNALAPVAVIELLPGATPQVLHRAKDFWSSLPGDVGTHVTYVTDAWALTPGFECGTLAEKFSTALHPMGNSATSRSAP